MSEQAESHLLSETADGVLTITFNRPAKKNAFTLDMYDRWTAAMKAGAEDREVKAVLLRGAGGVFTAGNDLMDFMKSPPTGTDTPVFRLLETLVRYEKPIVAAVAGPAIGIGTTMLLHCDLVYTGESAKLKMPFVDLGLCPEAGSSLLLPAMMGHQRAAALLMLGESLTGARAVALGLANEVLPDGELDAYAAEKARILAAKAPTSVRLTKALMRKAQAATVESMMLEEGKHFIERLQSDEAREAFGAFFEKRPPDFSRFG